MKYYKDSLTIKQKIYNKFHPSIATSFANLANAYLMIGKHEKALEYTNNEMDQLVNLNGYEDPSLSFCF